MREFLLAMLLLLMRLVAWPLVLIGTALAVAAVMITVNGSANPWLAFAVGWAMTAIGVVGLVIKGRPHDVNSRRG
jgi:hypothetical protein